MADVHWQCQLNHLNLTSGLTEAPLTDADSLTVGEKFVLDCQGPEVAGINASASTIELPKEQQYALRILKNLGMDSHKASFVATSYSVNPGGHQFQNLFLSDGKSRIALDGIKFKVKSVITKENNPKNEAYPPWGPFGFSYPVWIWAGFVILFVFMTSFGIEKLIQIIKRKRFYKLLASNPPALSAYHAITKDLRQFGKEALRPSSFTSEVSLKLIDDLHQSFRWFLSRKLMFSCFDLSPSQILRAIKEKDENLFKKVSHTLSLALIEVERWQNRPSQIKLEDAGQLIEMVRGAAEMVQKHSSQKSEAHNSKVRLQAEV